MKPLPLVSLSQQITLNEISSGVVTLFPSALILQLQILWLISIPPVPICYLSLKLKANHWQNLSISILVTSTVSQRTKKFMIAVFLFFSCLVCLDFPLSLTAVFSQLSPHGNSKMILWWNCMRTFSFFLFHLDLYYQWSILVQTASVPVTSVSSSWLVPTFTPATDDAAGSDRVKVVARGEETDDLPLVPPFIPARDDAAHSDEVNAATNGD